MKILKDTEQRGSTNSLSSFQHYGQLPAASD